jgi:hypothetical protein
VLPDAGVYLLDKSGTLGGMESNSGDPKPTTTRDRLEWAPLIVNGRTIGLVCPYCGAVVPPSDAYSQAHHGVRCVVGND